ncbi:MAG: 1-acyl-sn-glycerol-3-phosphate acyltransferase, partial [Bacteroidales bacterium]|nr:1-acyl-sn-glycerol-3-phosphate acyltransferase [Bacteroidales bacterium]
MEDFESIRPYNDSEVNEKLIRYNDSSVFNKLVSHIYPTWTPTTIARRTKNITSAQAFQELLIFPAAKAAIDRSMEQFTISGLENIDPEENYLFISNHRDIVLDSTLIYYVLFQNGYKAGQVAIGDNLLTSELVTDLVKMNRTFIVKRNLPAREMIETSKILSRYMRYVLTEKKDSIWISHREGRTKDGNDKTNPGVLKMIAMDCPEDKMNYLKSLRIVPVTIAYEYDSCDALKANELTEIELTGSYKKDGTEDMKSIITGVT